MKHSIHSSRRVNRRRVSLVLLVLILGVICLNHLFAREAPPSSTGMPEEHELTQVLSEVDGVEWTQSGMANYVRVPHPLSAADRKKALFIARSLAFPVIADPSATHIQVVAQEVSR